jgi:hypothetical protein
VLTNAIDGPAQECALAAVRLLDLAHKDERPAAAGNLAPFTGRFADLWGVVDVAVLGGRLFLLKPTGANPAEGAAELEVVDDSTLRIVGGPGYGSYHEPVSYTFDGDTIVSVRIESGLTYVPVEAYRLPARVVVP